VECAVPIKFKLKNEGKNGSSIFLDIIWFDSFVATACG
jgi:hypothetical protein